MDMWLSLKQLLVDTDETRVSETQEDACRLTETLLSHVKENFATRVETLSASMATGSDMTQDMAVETIMSLVAGKSGFDKLEAQIHICGYCDVLCRVNDLIRTGMKAFLAIAVACHEHGIRCLPANIRTLFNACIVFAKKGDDNIMHFVFWTPKCRTRNAVATHAIAQGCFIRSDAMEHLFTTDLPSVQIETREKPDTRGEIVNKPVIEYQWGEKSQRILTFWNHIGSDRKTWEKALGQFDPDAREHIVDFESKQVENCAKASVSSNLKGLETTKKASNAVKVRNAKLKKLFADLDY